MNIEALRSYCLNKPGTIEDLPFDEHTLVFKVGGKIFAITGLENPELRVNLKCDPDRAQELREQFSCVLPGYHMNKKHWNTVVFETGELSDAELKELVDHSYDLIVAKLPSKIRNTLS